MTSTDFMEEKEVFELLGKKKQQYGGYVKITGSSPVLTYPTRYSRKAVTRWIEEGGINRQI